MRRLSVVYFGALISRCSARPNDKRQSFTPDPKLCCRHVCPDNESGVPHTGVTWFHTEELRTAHERGEHPLCVSPFCNVGAYYVGIDDALRRFDAARNDEPAAPAGRLSTVQQWKEVSAAARRDARRRIVRDELAVDDDDDDDNHGNVVAGSISADAIVDNSSVSQ